MRLKGSRGSGRQSTRQDRASQRKSSRKIEESREEAHSELERQTNQFPGNPDSRIPDHPQIPDIRRTNVLTGFQTSLTLWELCERDGIIVKSQITCGFPEDQR
ncbi:hypothetical protein AVEN_10810-1 [Araneus ventricosus]|uniref:Uncharacterized protein n=1 Tax=Araneus ventricosus TaxID=182803 RepID=A0A4Y2SHI0_ARAVE|nr:hypothetical protein AVEN_10810-1 [Araneus ventricosus]